LSESYKSPLHKMALTTPTDYWNDSCSVEELTYAIDNGAVGATTNPSIVLGVLKKEMHLWRERILQLIRDNPLWDEEQITWKLIEEMAVRGAGLLHPIFERTNGMKGRISIQTNPAFYRNAKAILEQALHFDTLADNMQIKIPVTKAGIEAIEEATSQGVNINATVCFTVPQALAVAEAVERGLNRRTTAGKSTAAMTPVCTIMIGRLDDWVHILEKKDDMVFTPGILDWAGIAALKKAYALFKERGYRARLLAAAYRHHLHWSELIGGEISLTIPYEWQRLFNTSSIEVIDRFQNPVSEAIVAEMYQRLPDFRRAYDVDGMSIEDFDSYGATVRTLRTFITSYHELIGLVRDLMLPNPDVK
jgi:transaldolase